MSFLNNMLGLNGARKNTNDLFRLEQTPASSTFTTNQGGNLFGGLSTGGNFQFTNAQSSQQQANTQPKQNSLNDMLGVNSARPNTNSLFTLAPTTSAFGGSGQGGLFGGAAAPQNGSIFGKPGESKGLFGASTQSINNNSSTSEPPKQPNSIFNTPLPQNTNTFGQPGQPGSIFGQTTGLFSKSSENKTSFSGAGSLFGAFGQSGSTGGQKDDEPSSKAPTSGLIFGKPEQNTEKSSDLFDEPKDIHESPNAKFDLPPPSSLAQDPDLNAKEDQPDSDEGFLKLDDDDANNNNELPLEASNQEDRPSELDKETPIEEQSQDKSASTGVDDNNDKKDEFDLSFLGKAPSGPSMFDTQESNLESVFKSLSDIKPPTDITGSAQPAQPAQSTSLFSSSPSQSAQPTSLFSSSSPSQPQTGIFGSTQSGKPSIFSEASGSSSSLFKIPEESKPQANLFSTNKSDLSVPPVDKSASTKALDKKSQSSTSDDDDDDDDDFLKLDDDANNNNDELPLEASNQEYRPSELDKETPIEEQSQDKSASTGVDDNNDKKDDFDLSFLGKAPSGPSMFDTQESNLESVFKSLSSIKPPTDITGSAQPAQPAQSTSLFSSSSPSQPAQPTSLFSSSSQSAQPTSLFSSSSQSAQPTSLFSSSPSQPSTGTNKGGSTTSIFGQNSLFSGKSTDTPTLFGGSNTLFKKPEQSKQQTTVPTSLFGSSAEPQQPQSSLFSGSFGSPSSPSPPPPQQEQRNKEDSKKSTEHKPAKDEEDDSDDDSDDDDLGNYVNVDNLISEGSVEWTLCDNDHTDIVAYCKECRTFQCDECALKCMNMEHQLIELSSQASDYKILLTTVKDRIEKRNVESKLEHLKKAASTASAAIDEYFDNLIAEAERCRALAKQDLHKRKEEYANSLSLKGTSEFINEIREITNIDPDSSPSSMIELLIRGSCALRKLKNTPNLLIECEEAEGEDNNDDGDDDSSFAKPAITFKAALEIKELEKILESRIFLRPYMRIMRIGIERLQVSVRPLPREDESIEIEYKPAKGSEGDKKICTSKKQSTIITIDPHTSYKIRARIIGGTWHSEWSDTMNIDTERRWEQCDGFEISEDGCTITKTRKDTTYIPARVAWKAPEGVITRWTFKVAQSMRNRIAIGMQAIPFENSCCALFSCEGGHVSGIPPHGKTFAIPKKLSGSIKGKTVSVVIDLRDKNFAALTFEMDGKTSCNTINTRDIRKDNLCLIAYMSNCGDSLSLENIAEEQDVAALQKNNSENQNHEFGLLENATEINTFFSLKKNYDSIPSATAKSNVNNNDDDDDNIFNLSDNEDDKTKTEHKTFERGATTTFGEGKYDDDDDDDNDDDDDDITNYIPVPVPFPSFTKEDKTDEPSSSQPRKSSDFNPNSQKFIPKHLSAAAQKANDNVAEQNPAAPQDTNEDKPLITSKVKHVFGIMTPVNGKGKQSAPLKIQTTQNSSLGTQNTVENRSLSTSPGYDDSNTPNKYIFSFFNIPTPPTTTDDNDDDTTDNDDNDDDTAAATTPNGPIFAGGSNNLFG